MANAKRLMGVGAPASLAKEIALQIEEGGGGEPVEPQTWQTLPGKPAVIAAGADAAAARTAIGAGTGNSNLQLGTTATTAKPGDYSPPLAGAEVDGLVRIATNTVQTVAPATATTMANRSYMVQKLASNQLVVNVPWTVYTLTAAAAGAIGGVRLGAAVPNATEGDVLVALNALLASLRAAGVIAT